MVACHYKRLWLVNYLLEAGADVNICIEIGVPPILFCIPNNDNNALSVKGRHLHQQSE